jgi:type VI protein secretion system component VasK
LANLLKLPAPKHHLIVFPAVLVWWWFLGKTLDSGLVKRPHRRRWLALPVLVAVALMLWVATSVSVDAFHWWLRYGGGDAFSMLTVLRLLTPAVWCYGLVGLSALAWRRSARH